MAVSLLLVPIGSALIAGGFRDGVTLGWMLPPNWLFLIGMASILSPFWVLCFRWSQLRKRRRKSDSDEESRRTSSAEDDDRDDDSSDWAFLLSRAINETQTETIETPNPTSLEFDGYFTKIMEESLSKTSKRHRDGLLRPAKWCGSAPALFSASLAKDFVARGDLGTIARKEKCLRAHDTPRCTLGLEVGSRGAVVIISSTHSEPVHGGIRIRSRLRRSARRALANCSFLPQCGSSHTTRS